MSDGDVVTIIDIDALLAAQGIRYREAKDALHRLFCDAYTKNLLARTGGNKSQAARLAGVDRSAWRRLERKAEQPR